MVKSTGILLVNLGSPDSASVPDVRRYLAEFLMDRFVIDVGYLLRKLIVTFTILPFRPKRSAEAYGKIWQEGGSPLVVTSHHVHKKLQSRTNVPIALGMRYGNPSIRSGIEILMTRLDSLDELILIPLYPHYALSSFETAVDKTKSVLKDLQLSPRLHIVPPFFEREDYIQALVSVAEPHLKHVDHLLFSYHGLPERHIKKTDPTGSHCLKTPDCCTKHSAAFGVCYRAQVFKTTQKVMEKLNVPAHSVSFQSRLGRDPWLKPFTDHEFVRLAQSGVKNLAVICPAFVSDCLETLEEIGLSGREQFLEAGGESFQLIPCLNEHPLWIECLESMCKETLAEIELLPKKYTA